MALAAAAAVAVHPSPPPPARHTVAWLVGSNLAWAAVNTILCLFLASMWLFFWGLTTMEIGRLACGEGCAVVTGAYKVISMAGVTFMLVFATLSLLLALMMARALPGAAATDIEATKEPVPKTFDAALRDALRDPLTLGFLAFMAFALLMVIGALVEGDSTVMLSRRKRIGSVIYDVGVLGKSAVVCFILCPVWTVRVWRAWRMARARHAL